MARFYSKPFSGPAY